MAGTQWLPLFEYSNKYRVSVSTLRRRIKLDEIKFKLDAGKYFILDAPPERTSRETPKREKAISIATQPPVDFSWEENPIISQVVSPAPPRVSEPALKEPVFSTAQNILEELKRAYTQILQEKDEQIKILREEITDLKTLVRVLESETQV